MKYQIILILLLISLVASTALAINEQDGEICGEGQSSACSIVNNSDYSKFMGIKNSYYGVVIFTLMSILTFSFLRKPNFFKKSMIHIGIFVGALVAIWFIYVQEFKIGVYCPYCMIIDMGMILSLGIILFWKRNKKHRLLE